MKVKEIIESYSWDHGMQLISREREADAHRHLEKPSEPIYIVVDKKGKAVRTNLSHKAAVYIKDRKDLIKKHGHLTIKRVQ